ncbi:MAG: alanine/glycine:cation symporter family protein [Methanosarcina thermophila]|jgi:AGCS family alanine or glycine:cation symporter|uniref:Alanine or glycine:cation symporter, AGCS family n=3 Tax=Methanosarcina thermophila TaxID=2210 RepID=A0A1I6Z6V0_METTE|nr:sodium:alanine symporter family protein [Methanosarcina thermophila]ALK06410.1 MAG: sodium:alanine symporter [Methanosarcina sp. 795]AKB11943.1 Sodium/glycine symporter GlyP [Methanosarcina thermophila TM-1]AKB14860.1 Sodium/glycine symporter GlyP [Methanosarcina thermophila CHTI-55]NLU55945.1 sodium:alanine symporter family protein [Methanosarcina thermophila]SFT58405.1 alanine or glycine:cation symporter, AGCS family [Methanosarcina thermophila]
MELAGIDIFDILTAIDQFIWGPPLLILLVGTGIFLTWKLGMIQVFRLPLALKYVLNSRKAEIGVQGDVSSFAALSTALSATIGTGNIVGVATALKTGGPGALFWMLFAAFFGMATMYSESLLAVKYRTVDANGQMSGGPMYYIRDGLKEKKYSRVLASVFAFFGVSVSLFGIGIFPQVNAIVDSARIAFDIPEVLSAAVISLLVAFVTLGGIRRIAAVAQFLVPFMAAGYVLGCVLVIGLNLEKVPETLALIISSAFTGTAAQGGFLGAGVMLAIRIGIARGVFSNESGLGSAPIAAAAAKVKEPARQGLISMTGTFFDTFIICLMTGTVLIITDSWKGELAGAYMTSYAFSTVLSEIGSYIVTVGLICFAFTTILGWNYYGERCTEFLFGVKGILPYKLVYILIVASGAFLTLDVIWVLADIVNGLMAIPNLIALLALRKVIASETRQYFKKLEAETSNTTKVSK